MSAGALSLAELEAFDPRAPKKDPERDYCCPLCGHVKRKDAAHRCLSVNTRTGAWKCHRCGASGLLAEFHTERKAPSRQARARRDLHRFAALPDEGRALDQAAGGKRQCWREEIRNQRDLAGTPGAAYLAGRGIDVGLAHRAGVHYQAAFYGRPAVVFPIRDQAGRLVAAQGRRLAADAKPKALTCGPVGAGVFATPGALEAEPLVITEAPLDALSLAVSGLPAVALCGTSLRPWLLPQLAWRRVLLAFDADERGDQAAKEWTAALRQFGARVERLRPGAGAKDWNDVLTTDGADALRAALPPMEAPSAAPVAREEAPRSLSLEEGPDEDDGSETDRAGKGSERPTQTTEGAGPAAELLAPFAGLLETAHRGLMPPGPIRIRPWETVTDPAAYVVTLAREVRMWAPFAQGPSHCAYLWAGVVEDRMEALRLLDEAVRRRQTRP